MTRFDKPHFPLRIQAILDEIAEKLEASGDTSLAREVDATTETLAKDKRETIKDEKEAKQVTNELASRCAEELVKILTRENVEHSPYQIRHFEELVRDYFDQYFC